MKWVAIRARAKSVDDFALLTKMLSALGLWADEVEDYRSFRVQMFRPEALILEIVSHESGANHPDLELTVSDPDSAATILKKMGLEILGDHSGPEPQNTGRTFHVKLPGGTIVDFLGIRIGGREPAHFATEGDLNASGKTFGVVVSRFNSFITERLLAGTIDGLLRCGVKSKDGIATVRVPGAFEIPLAARALALTGKYDAIICIGCLLRGDTAHYDVIVNEVTRGIGQSAQETGVPHAFGVLTCDTLEQAIDRAGLKMGNKGFEAALAAVEMASLKKAIGSQPSAVSYKQTARIARNDKAKMQPTKKITRKRR